MLWEHSKNNTNWPTQTERDDKDDVDDDGGEGSSRNLFFHRNYQPNIFGEIRNFHSGCSKK